MPGAAAVAGRTLLVAPILAGAVALALMTDGDDALMPSARAPSVMPAVAARPAIRYDAAVGGARAAARVARGANAPSAPVTRARLRAAPAVLRDPEALCAALAEAGYANAGWRPAPLARGYECLREGRTGSGAGERLFFIASGTEDRVRRLRAKVSRETAPDATVPDADARGERFPGPGIFMFLAALSTALDREVPGTVTKRLRAAGAPDAVGTGIDADGAAAGSDWIDAGWARFRVRPERGDLAAVHVMIEFPADEPSNAMPIDVAPDEPAPATPKGLVSAE